MIGTANGVCVRSLLAASAVNVFLFLFVYICSLLLKRLVESLHKNLHVLFGCHKETNAINKHDLERRVRGQHCLLRPVLQIASGQRSVYK